MTGLREWFAETDERNAAPRIPVMVNMASTSVSSRKSQKLHDSSVHPSGSLDHNRNSVTMDEYSDEDEEFQLAESEQEVRFLFMLICSTLIPENRLFFLLLLFQFP